MYNYRDVYEFTAKQNKRYFCTYVLCASKEFRATGFGQAEFPDVSLPDLKIWGSGIIRFKHILCKYA